MNANLPAYLFGMARCRRSQCLPLCAFLLAHSFLVWSANASEPPRVPLDQLAGRITNSHGNGGLVHIERPGEQPFDAPLPVWVAYDDFVTVGRDTFVRVDTADQHFDLPSDGILEWRVPPAPGPRPSGLGAFTSTLWQGLFGPVQKIPFSAVGRGAEDCPSASPDGRQPLAPLGRLSDPDQQIGADLRQLVAMWKPSPEPRSVFVKLLRQDGSPIVQGATCRESNVVLKLRAGDIHAGDHVRLRVTDTDGGVIEYNVAVIPPASLPQPPTRVLEEWLAATWRLQTGTVATGLDSVSRIAKASDNSFGAQAVLGAISTDSPF